MAENKNFENQSRPVRSFFLSEKKNYRNRITRSTGGFPVRRVFEQRDRPRAGPVIMDLQDINK